MIQMTRSHSKNSCNLVQKFFFFKSQCIESRRKWDLMLIKTKLNILTVTNSSKKLSYAFFEKPSKNPRAIIW